MLCLKEHLEKLAERRLSRMQEELEAAQKASSEESRALINGASGSLSEGIFELASMLSDMQEAVMEMGALVSEVYMSAAADGEGGGGDGEAVSEGD